MGKLNVQTPVPCQWSGAAFAGAVQGSQPQSFGLITLFLLTEHLCLPPRNEHPVPGTWLGGAFKRQAAVKDKIGKDQMWPGGSVLETIIYRDLGRIAQEPFWGLQFQSLFFLVPSNPGHRQPRAKLCSSAAEGAEKMGQRLTCVGSRTPIQRETTAEPRENRRGGCLDPQHSVQKTLLIILHRNRDSKGWTLKDAAQSSSL